MLIQLSEVLSAVGKKKVYRVIPEMEQLCVNGLRYDVTAKEPADWVFVHAEEHLLTIMGRIQVTVCFFCDRCLEPVPYSFDIAVEKNLDVKEKEDDFPAEPEEESFIKELQFDTEQFILEEILTHMPVKILCREDCRGLCSSCGANLNEGECHCEEEPKDPRMAAILDIFRESGEQK